MGRKRKKDRDLPNRWTRNGGVIYYIVPPGQEHLWDGKKWFPLGKSEPEAYRRWAERVEAASNITTMSQLFDRYLMEHTPTVRPKTQAHQRRAIRNLRKVFGEFLVIEFQSSWAFKYYDERKKAGISAANTDLKTLNHVFSKAVEWGVIRNADHPTRGLKIKQSDPVRDRYVEDWELREFLKVVPEWLRLYVIFKLLTGMDKSTILSIKRADLIEEGIITARIKTKGKKRIYEWSPELKQCVEQIKALKLPVKSLHLFCDKHGRPYVNDDGYTSIFDGAWQRCMKKALETTELENRFTEHDLRAKVASDAESLDVAQKLLDHADVRITKRVYRRKVERVKPAKLESEY